MAIIMYGPEMTGFSTSHVLHICFGHPSKQCFIACIAMYQADNITLVLNRCYQTNGQFFAQSGGMRATCIPKEKFYNFRNYCLNMYDES